MKRRLPRAPKLMGIPFSKETGIDLTKAARDIATLRFSPKETRKEREQICQTCPSWNAQSNRCKECGCQMRVKISLNSSKCPLGKWGPFTPK